MSSVPAPPLPGALLVIAADVLVGAAIAARVSTAVGGVLLVAGALVFLGVVVELVRTSGPRTPTGR